MKLSRHYIRFHWRFPDQSAGNIKERVGAKFDEQDEAILKLDLHRSIPELLLIIRP